MRTPIAISLKILLFGLFFAIIQQQLFIDKYSVIYFGRQETAHNTVYMWLISGFANCSRLEFYDYTIIFISVYNKLGRVIIFLDE